MEVSGQLQAPATLPPLSENINTIKRNAEAVLKLSRVLGLEVNTLNMKCMVMFHHQKAGHNHDLSNC
jgi:hypothetical protein